MPGHTWQLVRVEHVHINEGGQAIIGNVKPGLFRGRDRTKNQGRFPEARSTDGNPSTSPGPRSLQTNTVNYGLRGPERRLAPHYV
jgi:hypothetical protein